MTGRPGICEFLLEQQNSLCELSAPLLRLFVKLQSVQQILFQFRELRYEIIPFTRQAVIFFRPTAFVAGSINLISGPVLTDLCDLSATVLELVLLLLDQEVQGFFPVGEA